VGLARAACYDGGMFFSRRGEILMLVSYIVGGIAGGLVAVAASYIWPNQFVAHIATGFVAAVLSWLAFGVIATKLGY
jgi:hypothetical protein